MKKRNQLFNSALHNEA